MPEPWPERGDEPRARAQPVVGPSAAAAARRSCAVGPYLHAPADCEAEAAAEIIRLRGAHNAVPAGFGQMRIELEEYLQERFECPAGETCVALFEGGPYS